MSPGPCTAHGMWLGVKHPQLFSTPQHLWAPTMLKKSLLGKLGVYFMDAFSSRRCWDEGLMLLTFQDKETHSLQRASHLGVQELRTTRMGENSFFGPHEHEEVPRAGSGGCVHTPVCSGSSAPHVLAQPEPGPHPSCPVSVLRSLGSREAGNAKSCSTEGF